MSHYPPASFQALPIQQQQQQRQPTMLPEGPPPAMMAPNEAGAVMKRFVSPKNVFICTGVLLLAMICVVPVWNAVALMQDFNYDFWVGTTVPTWMVTLCCGIVVLYVVTIFTFFSTARPQVQTEQTIMMIANIFITLLGLVLMLLSLPLSRQAVDTYMNLMHRCDYSEQTHRMYEYSQVLHNIRRTPLCLTKFSVEECPGYEDALPYTNILKKMESDFRCSGFCYRPSNAAMSAAQLANSTVHEAALISDHSNSAGRKKHREDHITRLALPSVEDRQLPQQTGGIVYPPTLFSDANYKASCEGMAARDMKNFAGDVGFQTFYQGIYLVLIAIATGFLKLVGFCVRKEKEEAKVPRGF